MRSIHDYLKQRTAAAYRELARSLEGVAEEDAAREARAGWDGGRFGAELDGSIAGIVRHVTAWKIAAADMLEGGPWAPEGPRAERWSALLGGLEGTHARVTRLLDAGWDFEAEVTWEGERMTILDVFTHLLEHDRYHAGQVNLLREQFRTAGEAGRGEGT